MKIPRSEIACGVSLALLAACGGGADAGTPVRSTADVAPPAASVSTALEESPTPARVPANAVAASAPVTVTATPQPQARPPLPPPGPTTLRLGPGELAEGDAACDRGDLAEAEKHYAGAPRGAPRDVGLARVRIARVGVPLDYGVAKGNVEIGAAERDLGRIARGSPAFGQAFVELGRARLLLGNATGAIDALKKGVALLPEEAEAHSQLGVALLATGHAADAVVELTRAADLDAGSAARRGNLGTALMMAGRTKEAIEQYETRVRIDDGDPRAHSDLGTALLGTQDLQRALSELQRAVEMEPGRASFRSNLGFALQQMGRPDRAIAEYREALRIDPTLVSAWINLATVLAPDPTTRPDARAALQRAKALSPDDPRVKANLEELDALEKAGSKSGERSGKSSARPASP